ncbi:PH domain-containing protein [Massiliimalia timonensis]|jgi:hypothetical protein|uniref:PH domain-containing protein n=1 Tax=Massiliimalia timonensis TaxID=1987501 RepID=UPI000B8AEA04|nr:PH domain-containing protein [Massiliimalia timonensis]MBS7174596.1 PH domain-containing protein [Clostridiales bacterium]
MGFLDKISGAAGNLNEMSPEALMQEYGAYLMTNEKINVGFKLVRDVVLITDKRIIDFDKQGATGQKMRVDSINLSSVIHVSAETSGFGLDDSEINIHYISSPYFKANGGVSIAEKKLEFPKKYNIQQLYRFLQELAYANHERINQ